MGVCVSYHYNGHNTCHGVGECCVGVCVSYYYNGHNTCHVWCVWVYVCHTITTVIKHVMGGMRDVCVSYHYNGHNICHGVCGCCVGVCVAYHYNGHYTFHGVVCGCGRLEPLPYRFKTQKEEGRIGGVGGGRVGGKRDKVYR